MQSSLGRWSVIEYVPPLREARAEAAVLLEPLPQPVEALGDRLARGERERLRALVDLDPGDDPFRLEQLRERRPVEPGLADRLVEQDHAADELLRAGRREEQVAVRLPVRLRRLDSDRVETLLDRGAALVRREDPFPAGDERLRGLVQLVLDHALPLQVGCLSPGIIAAAARPASGRGRRGEVGRCAHLPASSRV